MCLTSAVLKDETSVIRDIDGKNNMPLLFKKQNNFRHKMVLAAGYQSFHDVKKKNLKNPVVRFRAAGSVFRCTSNVTTR